MIVHQNHQWSAQPGTHWNTSGYLQHPNSCRQFDDGNRKQWRKSGFIINNYRNHCQTFMRPVSTTIRNQVEPFTSFASTLESLINHHRFTSQKLADNCAPVVCNTPLGFPVLPEVYNMKSGSSLSIHSHSHVSDCRSTKSEYQTSRPSTQRYLGAPCRRRWVKDSKCFTNIHYS